MIPVLFRMTSLAPDRSYDSDNSMDDDQETDEDFREKKKRKKSKTNKHFGFGSKKKRQNSLHNDGVNDEKKKQIKMDMIMITTALVLQDLPFFCLRMTLIFRCIEKL